MSELDKHCPNCGSLMICHRPDPPEPYQEWCCPECGEVIYNE